MIDVIKRALYRTSRALLICVPILSLGCASEQQRPVNTPPSLASAEQARKRAIELTGFQNAGAAEEIVLSNCEIEQEVGRPLWQVQLTGEKSASSGSTTGDSKGTTYVVLLDKNTGKLISVKSGYVPPTAKPLPATSSLTADEIASLQAMKVFQLKLTEDINGAEPAMNPKLTLLEALHSISDNLPDNPMDAYYVVWSHPPITVRPIPVWIVMWHNFPPTIPFMLGAKSSTVQARKPPPWEKSGQLYIVDADGGESLVISWFAERAF